MKKNSILIVFFYLFACQKASDINDSVKIPLSPENLTGKSESESSISLSWTDKSDNEIGFKIQRQVGPSSFMDVDSVASDVTVFTDKLLKENTSYTYRVYAFNSAGKSVAYTNEITVKTQLNQSVVASVSSLDCYRIYNKGSLTYDIVASGVSITIPYKGGNAGNYPAQSVNSSGVKGLVAELDPGKLSSGEGSLTFTITGKPSSYGYAVFSLGIAGQTCVVSRTVNASNSNPGTVSDYSGNSYSTVAIGSQIWMAENLRVNVYNDGTTIPLVADSAKWANNYLNGKLPMMCWYKNDESTYKSNKIGALYNWYAIDPQSNGNKNICPEGWHVPNDSDWVSLIAYLDPYFVKDDVKISLTAGEKMKSTGTSVWAFPNTGATNSSGFSGLPGGYRMFYGNFEHVGNIGYWWSATELINECGSGYSLYYNMTQVLREVAGKDHGFSVRCIRD